LALKRKMGRQQRLTVIGGGLVGSAIAYGACRQGMSVRLLDQGDVALRASRGNFGLVWLSGKGAGRPDYARWTRHSCLLWQKLHQELLEVSGVDSGFAQPGGFWLGFNEKEIEERQNLLARIEEEADIPFEMMERDQLCAYLPHLGPKVVGGSFCSLDAHVNPLMLLQALHAGFKARGGELVSGADIVKIEHYSHHFHFRLTARDGNCWKSDRLVLANGLGLGTLAAQLGMKVMMPTSRGQILITERLAPFLHYPTSGLRQTCEGTVQIGSTTEYVGIDEGTTTDGIAQLAKRALACFPILERVRIVRAWGALRPLSEDGYPIYAHVDDCPGAYIITCHSGVTLAAAHVYSIAPWMSGLKDRPAEVASFGHERFFKNRF